MPKSTFLSQRLPHRYFPKALQRLSNSKITETTPTPSFSLPFVSTTGCRLGHSLRVKAMRKVSVVAGNNFPPFHFFHVGLFVFSFMNQPTYSLECVNGWYGHVWLSCAQCRPFELGFVCSLKEILTCLLNATRNPLHDDSTRRVTRILEHSLTPCAPFHLYPTVIHVDNGTLFQ